MAHLELSDPELIPGQACPWERGTRVKHYIKPRTGTIYGHWPSGNVRFPYLVEWDVADGERQGFMDCEARELERL